jgi:hypothetical protein
MTAWTKGLETAPKDKPVLIRIPKWDCPAVMRHEVVEHDEGWGFVEAVLADIAGWLDGDEIARAEWALLPE